MDLIKTNHNDNGEIIISGRELHAFLKVKARYNDWFNRMKEYGFIENQDYVAITQKRVTAQGNETTYTDHALKIDMAKEISMIQRTEKGKQARQYFIEVERRYKQEIAQPQFHLPQTYKEALLMLAESVDENDKLRQQIENDREKVVLANAITTSDEGLLIEAAAKYMRQNGVNIGRDRLFKWLRGQGYLVNRKGREWNMPTQKSLNQGLMKIHCQLDYDSEGELRTNRQVVVTGKGLMYFINKFLHENQLTLRLE